MISAKSVLKRIEKAKAAYYKAADAEKIAVREAEVAGKRAAMADWREAKTATRAWEKARSARGRAERRTEDLGRKLAFLETGRLEFR